MKALLIKAEEVFAYLNILPEVISCSLYGSLLNSSADKYSDIDIKVDVSGSDNEVFMKSLPELMAERSPIIWHDFAPSLTPEQYVVSIAIDEGNPFGVVDFNCTATPHIKSVQKGDLENDIYFHLIKLWTANCKHHIRGVECTRDVQKMGRRTIGPECATMANEQILEEILRQLERNVTLGTAVYIRNCRKAWDEFCLAKLNSDS